MGTLNFLRSFCRRSVKPITVFGGFAPNSESAQVLSNALGTKTVQSGSVNRGKNDPSQSLQMIERALLTPDELKSLPKGTFVVMKTGFYPMQVKLKFFSKWGIVFPKGFYTVADRGNRKVTYASKKSLEAKLPAPETSKSVGTVMTVEEVLKRQEMSAKTTRASFGQVKPMSAKPDEKPAGDVGDGSDSMPMSESNISSREETEILINKDGDIICERLRTDIPR